MISFKTFTSAALTAVLGLGAMTLSPTEAQALSVYNCTNDQLPVSVVHVPSGRQYETKTLAPGRGADWDTGRGDGFRISINVIGPDKRFSNRNGGETISIAKVNGNTELLSGRRCSQGGQGDAGRDKIKNVKFKSGLGVNGRLRAAIRTGAAASGKARVCFVNKGLFEAALQHNVSGTNPLKAQPGGQSCANFRAGSKVKFTLVERAIGANWVEAKPKRVAYDLSPYTGDVVQLTWKPN